MGPIGHLVRELSPKNMVFRQNPKGIGIKFHPILLKFKMLLGIGVTMIEAKFQIDPIYIVGARPQKVRFLAIFSTEQ